MSSWNISKKFGRPLLHWYDQRGQDITPLSWWFWKVQSLCLQCGWIIITATLPDLPPSILVELENPTKIVASFYSMSSWEIVFMIWAVSTTPSICSLGCLPIFLADPCWFKVSSLDALLWQPWGVHFENLVKYSIKNLRPVWGMIFISKPMAKPLGYTVYDNRKCSPMQNNVQHTSQWT